MSNVTSQAVPPVFRGEAFEYHFREQDSRGVLNTSIRHPWLLFLVSILNLGGALTYTLVAQVEVIYRAEGTMRLESPAGKPGHEQLAVATVQGKSEPDVKPGASVRLELLRPVGGRSQFIDGRLTALSRTPLRLEIALGQTSGPPANLSQEAAIPIRIHAVVCSQSLWRLALSAIPGCAER